MSLVFTNTVYYKIELEMSENQKEIIRSTLKGTKIS